MSDYHNRNSDMSKRPVPKAEASVSGLQASAVLFIVVPDSGTADAEILFIPSMIHLSADRYAIPLSLLKGNGSVPLLYPG